MIPMTFKVIIQIKVGDSFVVDKEIELPDVLFNVTVTELGSLIEDMKEYER